MMASIKMPRFIKRAPTIKEPEPTPRKVATLEERHAAMSAAQKALTGVLEVLEPGDEMDQAMADVLVNAHKNLSARLLNETRIAALAVGPVPTQAPAPSVEI